MSIRMRHTKGHSGNRRSHHALKQLAVVKDEAGNMRLPHRLNEATGMYNGKQIVAAKSRTAAKEKKMKGPDTSPVAPHKHEHAHEAHLNAEAKPASSSKGFFGKFSGGGRPKARSGAGGGGV